MTNDDTNTDRVTRFEVINWTTDGLPVRSLTRYGVGVDLSLQDEGRTLKVFLKDGEPAPKPSQVDLFGEPALLSRDEILDHLGDVKRIADDARVSEYADRHRALERVSELLDTILSESGR